RRHPGAPAAMNTLRRLIAGCLVSVAALAGTGVHAAAGPAVCGGDGLPTCAQVTYVSPEYFVTGKPGTVTLEGTNLDGVVAVRVEPGDLPVASRHPGQDVIAVDLPGLGDGDYFFQLMLAGGPAPLVDGGGVIVNAAGAPAGPVAPRPDAQSTPAPTQA